jgi:hypothetical protein
VGLHINWTKAEEYVVDLGERIDENENAGGFESRGISEYRPCCSVIISYSVTVHIGQ